MFKNIILVSTGIFQPYLIINCKQLIKLGFKNIYIITEKKYFNKVPNNNNIHLVDSSIINLKYFDKKTKLDKKFRNGFCNNTSKRLFFVYEYMKMNNLKNVIHLENDVLLYSVMNYNFDEKIYITMDSKNRCIPGIIYIPKYDLFTKLIENYDFTKNDMINLANFYNNNKDIVKTFPIIDNSLDKCIYNENFQEFNSIFDGAAIGQYLGDVDPRNIAGDSTGFVNETCEIKYDKYRFKWVKKGNNYFPYIEINSKLIPINNLHIHCKKLEKFKIKNPVENKYIKKYVNTFITGEKIQFSCDHFVGTDKDFRFNPNVAQYKNRFIYLGSNSNLDNKPLIFCYTHLLDNIDKLVRTLEGLQNPFKIVLHNSDGSFNRKDLILFEKLPLLQRIYTQNMNVEHNKVFPLPIGLANSQWTHGNSKIHEEIYDMPIEKSKEIYFNFNKNTNKEKRNKCYNDIIKKGIKWNGNFPYKEYLIELKRHKYAICPEGNGIDTHRFWECLYMNTIPICLKNKVTTYYKQYFPIILLNDWQKLDVSKLSYSAIDYQYLDMKWIIKQIKIINFERSNLNKPKHHNHIEIFTKIYETNEWGNNQHKNYNGSSGGGSESNLEYNNFIISFIRKYNIDTVIDLGCGDWKSSWQIYNKLNVKYYGYDAYKDVITNHIEQYPQYNFYHLDILNNYQEIKSGDLCILKDILQHWTCKEIEYFLDKIQDKFKYILICNSKNQTSDYQDEPFRSRPLNVKYYPLKKYNPSIELEYSTKQLSIINNFPLKKYSLSRVDSKNEKLDLKLDKLFNHKRNGIFIELGANNGLNQSNTYFFEKVRNWTGILIEPSLSAYKECKINRPNSKCYNVACVSSDYKNEYVVGDFNGSLMSSVNGNRNNSRNLTKVKASTLMNILDSALSDSTISIDFLSLDTEGYELKILNGLDLKKYSPKYILIEIYKNQYTKIENYLLSNGYVLHSNFTNYNKKSYPQWDGTHNDYLFVFKGNTNNLQKVEKLVDSFFHKSNKFTSNETVAYYPDGTIVAGGFPKSNTFYRHICYYTIKEALIHLIKQNKSEYTIVETGCAAPGTKSTLLWDKFVNTFGGKVISVDLNQKAVDETNALTSSKTTVYYSDSLKLLPTLTEKIDFLYLDSYDINFLNPKPSADHHLKEFYCVKELLNYNCIILIDDTPLSPEWLDGGKRNSLYKKLKYHFNPDMAGKGSLVNHYLSQSTSEKIDHKYQVLWQFKNFPKNLFDIVITVGPNDKSVIEQQIKYTQKNIIGYRNIYLICYDPSIVIDGCITINEKIFPFNMETVEKYHGKIKRNGWYLQQLLKLYAGKIITGILDKYLVIDSDTFFLKPTKFIKDNKCLYNYGGEYNQPYFIHMEKLDKEFTKMDKDKSGICHHMIFEKKYIDEIISRVEKNHNDYFYIVFLKLVTDRCKSLSGASEYEIYFNYMLKFYPNKIIVRKLKWRNTATKPDNRNIKKKFKKFVYVSWHWSIRP